MAKLRSLHSTGVGSQSHNTPFLIHLANHYKRGYRCLADDAHLMKDIHRQRFGRRKQNRDSTAKQKTLKEVVCTFHVNRRNDQAI